MFDLFKKWFKKNRYRQETVCIYEEVPRVKIAVYDGFKVSEDKFIRDFSQDDQAKIIEREKKYQLNIFRIKTNMRRLNPNEYNKQKYYFDQGSVIHAGEVTEFYGKSTKMKRFFYNKRKNIV